MPEYKVVGKSLPRSDGKPKATGSAKYSADIVLPGMLHGKILRSPYPHAIILGIDTSEAEKFPGVRAVLTSKDRSEPKEMCRAYARSRSRFSERECPFPREWTCHGPVSPGRTECR